MSELDKLRKKYDNPELKKVFTLENAKKKFAPDDFHSGEKIEAYWTPDLKDEEITLIFREKVGEEFQLLYKRIHVDAIIGSLSWDNLDWDCIEEIYITPNELELLNKFMEDE